jgi:AcrR family transcriptional regulator
MVRRYKLKERALSQQETRERIVEATVALHENPGPRATTISAIAERAGVQRLTVYRHFPTEEALFEACSSHWNAANPPPDPAGWSRIGDPRKRAHAAILALYRYFRASRRMLTSVLRDAPFSAVVEKALKPYRAYLEQVADSISDGLATNARASGVRVTLRHAVQFETWAMLARLGLDDEMAAQLVLGWIDGVRRDKALAAA